MSTHLKTASSNSQGMFVAPIISNRSSLEVVAPSIWVINSVFKRRDASCSDSLQKKLRIFKILVAMIKVVHGRFTSRVWVSYYQHVYVSSKQARMRIDTQVMTGTLQNEKEIVKLKYSSQQR